MIYQNLWILKDDESNALHLREYEKLRGLENCTKEEVEEAIAQWNLPAWKYHNDFPPKPPRFYEIILLARDEIKRRIERNSRKLLSPPPTEIEIRIRDGAIAVKKLKDANPELSWAEISKLHNKNLRQQACL